MDVLLNSAVAVCAELLSVGCGGAAGEQADHSPDERGQVTGLAARHPVAVLDHCLIHPIAAPVANVVLDRVVAGQGPPVHEPGRNQFPGRVTDSRERLAGVLHGPQEGCTSGTMRMVSAFTVPPGRWTASNCAAFTSRTVRSTLTLTVLSRSWRTPWISPVSSERIVTWAPASRSAFTGSVSSDSSKPSVARTATRKSVSSDMLVLLMCVRVGRWYCLPCRGECVQHRRDRKSTRLN